MLMVIHLKPIGWVEGPWQGWMAITVVPNNFLNYWTSQK